MPKYIKLFFLIFSCSAVSLKAFLPDEIADSTKISHAYFLDGQRPEIDGILDEEIWRKAIPISDFTQKTPLEGQPSRIDTKVRFLYDREALYVGIKVSYNVMQPIIANVTRRDNMGNSDRVIITIDTYESGVTSYSYALTASGVRSDYFHGSDNEYDRDYSYDAVWLGETRYDSTGWSGEMRIPFSQLRFNKQNEYNFGLNINKWTPGIKEDAYWVMIPKNETGWSSRFGRLVGIANIESNRSVELLPYLAFSYLNDPKILDIDPYNDKNETRFRAGLDLKYGISSNFTLDAAINPDFGQVEADPAEINLTAYETYFSERRPFFTEGKSLFEGGRANYFYSRRIGGKPALVPNAEYYSSPDYTSILGAAKLIGRTERGTSVGVLTALTNREYAEFRDADGNNKTLEVEPLSFYGVGRIEQEIDDNASKFGFIFTSVERDLSSSGLTNLLALRANAIGSDWNIRFNKGEYELLGHAGFTRVEGSVDYISNLQRSSARFYQRPDRKKSLMDTNANLLSGYTGSLTFNRQGGSKWLWGTTLWIESPGLAMNDIGFTQDVDELSFNNYVKYRENVPGEIFHSYSLRFSYDNSWNYDQDLIGSVIRLQSSFTLLSQNSFYAYLYARPETFDDTQTRGGPLMLSPSQMEIYTGFESDWSRNFTYGFDLSYLQDDHSKEAYGISVNTAVKTAERLELSLSLGFDHSRRPYQYLRTYAGGRDATYGKRYVFGKLKRQDLRLSLRTNYAFTTDLTVELFAEAYSSAGDFYSIGELLKARSSDLLYYGENGTSINEDENGNYQITADGNDYLLRNPDFQYLSFRSNLVLRWEFTAGSTLYLVWQQNKNNYDHRYYESNFGSLIDAFGIEGSNSLALKISYWIPVSI